MSSRSLARADLQLASEEQKASTMESASLEDTGAENNGTHATLNSVQKFLASLSDPVAAIRRMSRNSKFKQRIFEDVQKYEDWANACFKQKDAEIKDLKAKNAKYRELILKRDDELFIRNGDLLVAETRAETAEAQLLGGVCLKGCPDQKVIRDLEARIEHGQAEYADEVQMRLAAQDNARKLQEQNDRLMSRIDDLEAWQDRAKAAINQTDQIGRRSKFRPILATNVHGLRC